MSPVITNHDNCFVEQPSGSRQQQTIQVNINTIIEHVTTVQFYDNGYNNMKCNQANRVVAIIQQYM